MLSIPCIIFAGGKSSRMGEDKALLPFGDSPTLTQFQLDKLQKIFKDVYISCKDSSKFNFEANFIYDIPTKSTYAPTTGFLAIYEKLQVDRFFVISVDTPLISKDEILQILKHDSIKSDATIAKTNFGMHPMFGIYHRSLLPSFEKMFHEDNHKLGYLLKNSNTSFVNFSNEDSFLNLNNQDDYKKALTLVNTSLL